MSSRPAVLDLIGNTPLLQVTRFDTGPCQLFLKLESQNPGGSIKDRIGLAMIEAAEREGKLPPGGTVIEATAGNTGLGLALVARAKGYKVLLVVPDKMSAEKVLHLKALGAEVHWTRSDVAKGHPAYYQDMAARLAKEVPNSYYVDQFNNPANPLAHETTTAPEIWQQAGHRVDAIVCGVGSGGTLTGLKRYFQRVNPPTEIVLADYIATGRIGDAGSWKCAASMWMPINRSDSSSRPTSLPSLSTGTCDTSDARMRWKAVSSWSSGATLTTSSSSMRREMRSRRSPTCGRCSSPWSNIQWSL